MSLWDRATRSALTEFGLGAASTWDQVNPVGVSKQSRKVIGAVPLPLRRTKKPGELIDPDLFEERGLLKTLKRKPGDLAVKTLYVFDVDETLIRTPPREKGMAAYERATGKPWPYKRWWSVPQSLLPPFKPNPKPAIKGAYLRAKNDVHGFVIVMTGRLNTPEMRKAVSRVLKNAGIDGHKHGHDLFLKNPAVRDTAGWKKQMVRGFAKRFPNVETIRMWDDRGDHVEQFKKQITDLGKQAHVTHVTEQWLHELFDRPKDITWLNTANVQRQLGAGSLDDVAEFQMGGILTKKQLGESWPNRARGQAQTMPAPTSSDKDTSDQEDGVEKPMDNPLPGNTGARVQFRAGGSRAHQRLRPPRPPR